MWCTIQVIFMLCVVIVVIAMVIGANIRTHDNSVYLCLYNILRICSRLNANKVLINHRYDAIRVYTMIAMCFYLKLVLVITFSFYIKTSKSIDSNAPLNNCVVGLHLYLSVFSMTHVFLVTQWQLDL